MKRLIINILKRFLAIIPIVLLFLVMYEQLIVLEKSNARQKVISEHTGHLNLMDYMISNVFDEYYSTLHLIKNSNEMSSYLANPTAENQREVELFFERMAQNRSYIKGLAVGGDPKGPKLALEALGDSYNVVEDSVPYPEFWNLIRQDVLSLPEDGFFFSPLMTLPPSTSISSITQIVLTGIPIYREGKASSLVAMMVDGDHILSIVSQFFAEHADEVSFYLVDSSGNLFFNSKPHGQDAGYVNGDVNIFMPRILKEAEFENSGEFSVDNRNFHYNTFDPYVGLSSFYDTHPHFLIGVISFSDEDVAILEDSFLLRNEELRWVLAFLIFLLAGFINLLAYFRRNDRELLSVSNLVSDQSHDGVVITDTLMHITYCNHTFELMTDLRSDEIRAGKHGVFNLDGSFYNAHDKLANASDGGMDVKSWKGFVWLQGKRHIGLTHLMLSRIAQNQGHVVHNVGLYSYPRNFSRESFDQLIISGTTETEELDMFPITLIEKKRTQDSPFLLIYMKLVNIDLIEAQYTLEEHYVLNARTRERLSEVIADDDLIIQYSPDTFVLTLTVDKKAQEQALDLIRKAFEKPLDVHNQKECISIRCGVSMVSHACANANMMLSQAKMAIAAQNHFQQEGLLRYDESVDAYLRRYHAILQAFPEALEREDIQLYFQPVVEVSTNRIVGAEALVRWTHPTLGSISPGEFIPIVEQNGLERSLGIYVVHTVASFLHDLGDHRPSGFSISVNLCPTELQDDDLVPQIVRALDAFSVPHEALVIELTERTLLTDIKVANSVLRQLDDERIRVAIDDFGTGFSSLSYLHGLDIDVLKIDRSFIKDYPASDEGVILKAMIGMAKELDITVIVEGIEIVSQLEFVRSLGVAAYQGFLFSPAVEGSTLKQMLKKRH
ncbi:EAL domain-containing protein [Pleomorphochaeta sp. DL1XJH-081]|uniref:sensor domain-containing protein n=1 Tax=Pleomorphochaeta sp. DL1XJH-081 TaxID=3409690 RepID=UPI003BB558E3